FSGFTGSAGTLVVGAKEAGLWTDGRYFLQAERELARSGITLYRMGEDKVPKISEYLKKALRPGQTLGFDGSVLSARLGQKLEEELAERNITINYKEDLAAKVWANRPPLPCQPVWELSLDWSGQSTADKLKAVRGKLRADNALLILNSLDDIMWLFNIRGSDIPHNPVAYSYAYIDQRKAFIFLQKGAFSEQLSEALAEAEVIILPYADFYYWLAGVRFRRAQKILLDSEKCNYYLYKILAEKARPYLAVSPTTTLKAEKNAVEQKHLRETYKKDSAAVIRFLKWLGEQKEPVSETQAAARMDALRREVDGFIDLSFETIAAYGENAAMMHYQATAGDESVLENEGFFLLDSGGQYYGGTTDITRTVVMGAISDEMRRHFTAALRGLLHFSNLVFLHGCTGRNLDIIARQPLWELRSDYKSGTGHGLGYMLGVHEGPQNVGLRYREEGPPEAVLEAGMLLSIEPGAYKAGAYGIRLENIVLIVEADKNDEGTFLGFETLTLVPLDLAGLDVSRLTAEEKGWLNAYHQRVYAEMGAYLSAEEREWLKLATRAV
ncbi:MAG: aminopeptidase P family N-terminal domain-containing protein, partial [Lachnospiraceae bacterium]|nr:aminopeptidase P family N-terminal domain-containing protein [Lachnospiraceae bacterium]